MNYFLYVAIYQMQYYKETVTSVESFLKVTPCTEDTRIIIYTDNVPYFETALSNASAVILENTTPDILNSWFEETDFIYIIKIKALMDFFKKYHGNVIYLDSDTFFTKDSRYLFDRLENGESIMYSRCLSLQEGLAQYDFAKINGISDKIKIALLFYKTVVETSMIRYPTYPISPDFRPFNAGAIGISRLNAHLLNEVLKLSLIINQHMFYIIGEEFAFSYFLQKAGRVTDCESEMCLYHYADNKFFRYVVGSYLGLLTEEDQKDLDSVLKRYGICEIDKYGLHLEDLPYFNKYLFSFFMPVWADKEVAFYVDKENCPYLSETIYKRCKEYQKITARNLL